MSDETPDEALRFEGVLSALERLVGQLEAGNLPLDEALALYERGVRLARRGNLLLDGAERRIQVLQRELNEEGS